MPVLVYQMSHDICLHLSENCFFPLKLLTVHFFGFFLEIPSDYCVGFLVIPLGFVVACFPQFLNEHGCILIHDTHVFVIIIEVRNLGGAFGKYMRCVLFQIFY